MAGWTPDRFRAGRHHPGIAAERRAPALRGALAVACADGLAPEEERMFLDVALELGIDGAAADAMLAEAKGAAS